MKQTLQNIKKINFLGIAQILLSAVLILAPLGVNAALNSHLDCNALGGIRCGETSITALITTIIQWALGLAFAVAVLFLIIGGFWYITSAGNEETAEKGKGTAINAIIGIIIIIMAYVIIQVVSNLVSNGNGSTQP